MSLYTPTSNGKPVTDNLIERLADKAETGYDTTALRRAGGRPPIGTGRRPRRSRASRSRTRPSPASFSQDHFGTAAVSASLDPAYEDRVCFVEEVDPVAL